MSNAPRPAEDVIADIHYLECGQCGNERVSSAACDLARDVERIVEALREEIQEMTDALEDLRREEECTKTTPTEMRAS